MGLYNGINWNIPHLSVRLNSIRYIVRLVINRRVYPLHRNHRSLKVRLLIVQSSPHRPIFIIIFHADLTAKVT